MSAVVFDRLYQSDPDPWAVDSRWYEERKRWLILAALGRRRYLRGYEAGCGNGHLAMPLAARCETFVASDASEEALSLARERAGLDMDIEFRQLALPDQWPVGRFDLIVLSEVLYFLDAASVDAAARHVRSHLTSDGEVIACNWRAHIDGYGHSGHDVHRQFEKALDLPRRFEYVDADFIMGAWTTQASVASVDCET
jgi:SAM-dependent methyltransferase